MSSVSSFKPEDDSESDFGAGVLRGLASGRQTRSASRAASIAAASSVSDTPSIAYLDPETDDTQARYADLDARIRSFDPGVLKEYSNFFEDEKGYFTFSKVDEKAEIFDVSQLGAVVWTATEKEKFFNHLDRKGRNGIREIAAAIGTKSELEVLDYVNLLHEGVISHHYQALQNSLVVLGEIPAALEISEPCRAGLDECAQVLAWKEEMDQYMVDRKRYGNNFVITDHQARKLVSDDIHESSRGSVHVAAAILNVPTWISLSRQIYMKFGGRKEEDDWANIIQTDSERPAMSGEALMDFYVLTVSITRRLIQSTIFLAMSRMRQLQQLDEEPSSDIRMEDVMTAIDVLNMKHSRGQFAFDAARRNGLTIVDVRNRKGWKPQVLNYDEVERILNGDDEDLHSDNVHSQSEPDDYDSEDEDFEEDEMAEKQSQPRESARAERQLPAALEAEAGADDADDEEEEEDGDEAQDQDGDQQQEAHQHPEPEPELEPPPKSPHPERDTKPDDPDFQDPDHFQPPSRRLSIQSFLSSGEEEQASDAEEEHADRHDREQNRLAEMELWRLLRRPGPPAISIPLFTDEELKQDAQNRPLVLRKTRRELTNWRDLTLYHSEWEEYGSDGPDLVEELAENRRKRRRIDEENIWFETGDEDEEDEQDVEDEHETERNEEPMDPGDGAEVPIYKSASVVNSEESDVDQMDVDDDAEIGASGPSKSPSIAVELPKYDPDARDALPRSSSGSQSEYME